MGLNLAVERMCGQNPARIIGQLDWEKIDAFRALKHLAARIRPPCYYQILSKQNATTYAGGIEIC